VPILRWLVLLVTLALTVYLFVVFSRSASVYCSRHNQSNSHDPGSLAADGNYLSDNDCSGSSFLPSRLMAESGAGWFGFNWWSFYSATAKTVRVRLTTAALQQERDPENVGQTTGVSGASNLLPVIDLLKQVQERRQPRTSWYRANS